MANPASLLADLDFVRRLAQRLCGDEHTAEDVAQQTMVAALENPPKDGNFRGWLATVARSLVYKQHRGATRRVAREQAVARALDEPSTEEVLAREQVRSEVVHAVLALPDDHRQIILLRFYRGVSVGDCATRIGITESAVRSRTARAIERLRVRLDERHGGERQRWQAILLPFAVPLPQTDKVATATVRRSVWVTLAAAIIVTATWTATTIGGDPQVPQANDAAAAPTAQQEPLAKPAAPQPVRQDVTPPVEAPPRWSANGIVKGDDGVLAGATIKSWLSTGSPDPADWVQLPDQLSDDDGRFTIPLRPLETWSKLARTHAWLTTLVSHDGYWSDQRGSRCSDIMVSQDKLHIRSRLDAGANIRGRLLRPDGAAAIGCEMRAVTQNGKRMYDVFRDGTFQAYSDGSKLLLSCGVGGHGQYLELVDLAGKPRLDLGDVHLDGSGPFLTGTARYPDGTPMRDMPVILMDKLPNEHDLTESDYAIEVEGLTFTNDTVMTRRPFGLHRNTRTDENGNFRILHAGPGNYRMVFKNGSYFQKEFELTGTGDQHLDVVFEARSPIAHVKVFAQDEDGRVLHNAQIKWHKWRADQAATARARYEREGCTDGLLATAWSNSNNVRNRQPQAPIVIVPQESFTLFEISIGGAETVHVPCHLQPGKYEKTIRVILAPPGRTSPLQIEAIAPDGEPVSGLFVRVREQNAPSESALQLDAKPPQGGAKVRIAGTWNAVPKDGHLNLPPGTYELDLLAGGRNDRGLMAGSNHPITLHTVTIERDKPATLRAILPPGARMRLQVATPRGFDLTSFSMHDQMVTLAPSGKGHPITMKFRPFENDRIDDGTIVLEAEQGIPKGEYRVSFAPRTSRIVKNDDPQISGPFRLARVPWQSIDQLVFFERKPEPFPVQLVETAK